MHPLVSDLLAYIDASPTPYHAVAETSRRLEAAGYARLDEGAAWTVEPGQRGLVVRGGSLIAFERGSQDPVEAGFRLIGAHTDSPNLRIKPNPERTEYGIRILAAEPYGGVLLHTWLDRDLGLAGRVVVRDAGGGTRTALVRIDRPILRVPNLAIHLQRELRTEGLKLNRQDHMSPFFGLSGQTTLESVLRDAIDGEAGEILSWDLMVFDLTPSSVGGVDDAFVFAPRLDNLASCHAGLAALTTGGAGEVPAFTRVLALWDHEEVGSRTASGAGGPFLRDVLERLTAPGEAYARAVSRSALVSADMAHAVHPHFAARHDPQHMPKLGQGPVIKVNTNQSYASDAETIALFAALCDDVGVAYQRFVNRSDLACGSTIGPITATRLGIPTVDVGNPMLSMHSAREMSAADDVEPMVRVMRAFYGTQEDPA
ncbi:MAG: M18 family aminopeptidase [Planctomycetota bacterium]|nr:M18 family aminopeptidase [Planctomycetota bacterium]